MDCGTLGRGLLLILGDDLVDVVLNSKLLEELLGFSGILTGGSSIGIRVDLGFNVSSTDDTLHSWTLTIFLRGNIVLSVSFLHGSGNLDVLNILALLGQVTFSVLHKVLNITKDLVLLLRVVLIISFSDGLSMMVTIFLQ